MYTIKVSDGYVYDEPEMATVDYIGTYETLDEAAKAAASRFDAFLGRINDGTHICKVERDRYRHYVSYGYLGYELEISVIKR